MDHDLLTEQWACSESVNREVARISSVYAQRQELFLKWCFYKHMPPDIRNGFDYSNDALVYIAFWIKRNGYALRVHSDGKLEFCHGTEVLETLPSPALKQKLKKA